MDGWAATPPAWLPLFPLVGWLRCFLHGWLNIRRRGKLSEVFAALSRKVWDASPRAGPEKFRATAEAAGGGGPRAEAGGLLEQVQKRCRRSKEYGLAYEPPGGHRTSTMLDRLMRWMNRYFDAGQHLHGSEQAWERHVRAWALLENRRPWSPASRRANQGGGSPAERLHQHRDHEEWLHNLLVAASLAGYRH